MSHSKRNTSRPIFTSYERNLAKSAWANSSARLSRDSYLALDSCGLCLEPARDPVSCPRGDIFCRECALTNMLAQRKEARRLERARERAGREEADARAREDEEVRQQTVRQFELAQTGGGDGDGDGISAADGDGDGGGVGGGVVGAGAGDGERASRKRTAGDEVSGALGDVNADQASSDNVPRKRQHVLDEQDVERAAKEDRALSKPLVSPWAPTVNSSHSRALVKSVSDPAKAATTVAKMVPMCPAGSVSGSGSNSDSGAIPHHISMHSLISVIFTADATGARVCPCCLRGLSNASRALLFKPCGHVLCRSCVEQLFGQPLSADAPAVGCSVCDAPLTPPDAPSGGEKVRPDRLDTVVELRSEGTGFSARGANKVQKSGVAFQC